MKKILASSILATAAITTGCATTANAALTVTPKLGYVASTDGQAGRDKRDSAVYGVGLAVDAKPGTAVELEYLRSGDSRKYNTTAINLYQNLAGNNYAMIGVGHVANSKIGNQLAGQYGVGHKFATGTALALKAEIRSVHYLENSTSLKQRSHEVQLLVGTEFKF